MAKLDVAIIGGGPIGVACGIEAQKRNLSYQIIEKGSLNNSIRQFPVNVVFFSTPDMLELDGIPFTSTNVRPNRQEILRYYQKVASARDLNLMLYSRVESVKGSVGYFLLQLEDGNSIKAKNVVFATGYFDHPNKLHVPGEDLPHVSHYYDEAFRYTGMRVIVVGAQNSAVEAALDLYRHNADVTMVCREPEIGDKVKYWIRPDIVNRIEEGSIRAFFETEIESISKKACSLSAKHTADKWDEPADFVLLLTGYRPDEGFMRASGIDMNEDLVPSHNSQTMESNVKGIYVAGSAVAGCKPSLVFIENGREHARRLMEDIKQRT